MPMTDGCANSSAPSSPAMTSTPPTTPKQKKKMHVKTERYESRVALLKEERDKARKQLRDIRAKSKVEAKKHKRLMQKASRLSVQELQEIAEMKQTRIDAMKQLAEEKETSGDEDMVEDPRKNADEELRGEKKTDEKMAEAEEEE